MSNNKNIRAAVVAVNKAAAPWGAAIRSSLKNFAGSALAKSIRASSVPLLDHVRRANAEKDKLPGGEL